MAAAKRAPQKSKEKTVTKKPTRTTKTASKSKGLSRFSGYNPLQRARQRPLFAGILIVLCIGLGFLFWRAFAAQPDPIGSTADCGATVKPYNYQVPFANSPWNVPTCKIAPYDNNATLAREYGKRMYNYAKLWNASSDYKANEATVEGMIGKKGIAAEKGAWTLQLGLSGNENDYSTPIYYADKDTPRKKIKLCDGNSCFPSNLDQANCTDVSMPSGLACVAPDREIPWDPSWRGSGDAPSTNGVVAKDREAIVIDTVTGISYDLWNIDRDGSNCTARSITLSIFGKSPESRLCVGLAKMLRNSKGEPTSIYTYDEGVVASRGMGTQKSAMVVTPEEVLAGEIRHALTMEIAGSMAGSPCTEAQLAANNPAVVGKTCAFAAAPATQYEWDRAKDISRGSDLANEKVGQCSSSADQIADRTTTPMTTFRQLFTVDKTIPEGMRFKITWNDTQINQWIASRGFTGAKAKTAFVFARALRDYGFIAGDTGCSGAQFTTVGTINKDPDPKNDTATKWKAAGLSTSADETLLYGLFTEDNIIAVDSPTNQCLDEKKEKVISTSKFACKWLKSTYPNLTNVTSAPVVAATLTPTATPTTKPASDNNTSTTKSPTPKPTAKPSATATATLAPCNAASKTACTPSGTLPAVPTQPASVTASLQAVLTPTPRYNLELKWKASQAASGVKEYIITRNEVEVARTTTLSYVDKTIEANKLYIYTVRAIDTKGKESLPAIYAGAPKCASIICWL